MYQFLVVVGVLCGCVFSATVETQRLIHGRKIRQVQQTNNGNHSESRPTEMNIAFELPDITTTFELASGTVQLEAFKSTSNDRILQDATQSKTSQLFWVSIGHPNLVRTSDRKNASNLQLFHFSSRGFNTYIEMLTVTQRKALATAARNKYRVSISDNQVVHLILSRFQCTLLMHDEAGGKFLLSGKIFDFRHFPHRMDFDAPLNSIERRLFSKVIAESEDDLHFDCHIESSGGKVIKTNVLTISTDQLQKIGLEEKLFGPVVNNGSNEVYVSRNQMSELAHEMYSTLNIAEDYQMPETRFNEGFVDDFISQLSLSVFAQVPIDTVLASLSKYGFDIGADIQPDAIKRDIGSVLMVEKYNNRSRIVLNESMHHQTTNSVTISGEVGVGYWPFRSTASVEFAVGNKKTDEQSDRSLSDQLRELNAASKNEIKWDIDGNRVVPKSLNVARLTRSKLRRTLTFNRIRVQTFDSPFQRNFKLYADRSAVRKSMEESEERDWKLQIQNISFAVIRTEEAIQSMSQHLHTILAVSEEMRTLTTLNTTAILTDILAATFEMRTLTTLNTTAILTDILGETFDQRPAPLRLVNQGQVNSRQGRLEVYHRGSWGTICDDHFDDAVAGVACSSLGFGRRGRVIDNTFGPGTGQIWLDDVQCSGNEPTIATCSHSPWGSHNCQHTQDVAIVCNFLTQRKCPTGFDYLPETNGCFKVVRQKLTWSQASDACRGLISGAHLAAITSAAEQVEVQTYFSNLGIPRWDKFGWIGGQTQNPRLCSTPFVWKAMETSSGIPFTYTNWHQGEPNCGNGVENCVEFHSNGKWNDKSCDTQQFSICEF